MRSSYRIIKNSHVSLKESKAAIIDTSIDMLGNLYKDNIDTYENTIDEAALIENLKNQIKLENEKERQMIIERAKEEALRLKEDIEKKAYEKGYEEGYELGYEDGTTQGLNQGMHEALNIKKRALGLISQSEEYVKEYYMENKENLIELAATMAESIVHRTIDLSNENIIMILEPLLKEYAHKDNIIITCHPESIKYLKEKLEEMEEFSGNHKIVILKDGNLEKNGCMLENSQQLMDLQIKTQIENIIKDIKNME